jgi:hypothetical protein
VTDLFSGNVKENSGGPLATQACFVMFISSITVRNVFSTHLSSQLSDVAIACDAVFTTTPRRTLRTCGGQITSPPIVYDLT